MNKKSALLLFFSLQGVQVNYGDPCVKVTHFEAPGDHLAHPLTGELAGKPIVHLKTLAIQKDNFSCGYHALFNAVAFDKALQNSKYSDFETELRRYLADADLFFWVCGKAKEYLKDNHALNGKEIHEISKLFALDSRLISLYLTDTKELMIPCLSCTVHHPLTMQKEDVQKLLQEKQQELVYQKINQLLDTVKGKPYQVGHFVCNTGNHWILYSVASNSYGTPKVYMIGAWNEPLNDAMKYYALKLVNFIQ